MIFLKLVNRLGYCQHLLLWLRASVWGGKKGGCTQCGAKDPDNQPPTEPSEPTETTPPTDPEGPAQTGSSTPVELLALVLLLSAVSVTLIWEKRRSL